MKRGLVKVFLICTLLLLDGWYSHSTVGQEQPNPSKPIDNKSAGASIPSPSKTRQAFLEEVSLLESKVRKLNGAARGSTKAGKLYSEIAAFKKALQDNLGKSLSDTDARTNTIKIEGFKQEFNTLSQPNLSSVADETDGAKSTENQANNAAGREKDLPRGTSSNTEPETLLWFLLKWVVVILAASLLVGGIVLGILYLKRKKQRERSEIRAGFSDLKNRNSAFNQKLEELTKSIMGLNQQVAQQKADITRLKQNQTNQTTSDYPPPPPVAAIPREQPRFPVSVDDYIGKVGPGATAVKYEYKEGMLVSDPTNEGGLLIVQDEGRLYLIPSFGFFQTKSDYTNYFERFYTCAKPMGGNVLIRQPATVTQVAGGWQMATQGELEIR